MRLEVLTLASTCTLYMVLCQVLDHKLVLPVDCSSQAMEPRLLSPVDLSGQPLKHKLLGAVDPLQHTLEPRQLAHDDVHLHDGDWPQPPPPPDDRWTQGKGTSFVFRSVTLAQMASVRAMTTSPLSSDTGRCSAVALPTQLA